MGIYRFGGNSVIDELVTQSSKNGGLCAYAHARADASPKELEKVKHALVSNNMHWTPLGHAGKPCLEIRGLGKSEDNLLEFLKEKQFIPVNYEKEATVADKVSIIDKLKRNTLRLSGLSYFIGDVGFMAYGAKKAAREGSWHEFIAGVFYAMGSPFIAVFGHGNKSDKHLKDLSQSTVKQLHASGIDIPESSALHIMTHGYNNTLSKKIISFCEQHPAEISNSFFGLAGAMILGGRVRDLKEFKKDMAETGTSSHKRTSIFMDMGLGIMTMAAGLISVFVQEEERKPGEERKKGLKGAWQYIKEKPLRAAGGALGLSTLAHAGSTMIDYKKAMDDIANPSSVSPAQLEASINQRKAIPGRGVFIATNLNAELWMSLSSKGHGNGISRDESLENSLYGIMAELLHTLPVEQREQALGTIALHLAEKKNLGISAAVISEAIQNHLLAIETNPWAEKKPVEAQGVSETRDSKLWENQFSARRKEESHVEFVRNNNKLTSRELTTSSAL